MTNRRADQTNAPTEAQKQQGASKERQPDNGQGRVDDVRGSGVYPASGPWPQGDAPVRTMAEWDQGERGAAGYADHGESELNLGGRAMGNPPQQCRDIMTKDPVCALAGDTVDRVAQLMKREDIGPVPVVDGQQTKKLVGIVTDRDLAIKVVAEGLHSQRTRVEEVMTHNPVTCRPEDDIEQAIQAMAQYQIRRIPVVTTDGRVVGIIAQADVATRLEEPQQTAEMVEEISQPTTL